MGFQYLFAAILILTPLRVLASADCTLLGFLSPTERMASDSSVSETEKFIKLLYLLSNSHAIDAAALQSLLMSDVPLNPMDFVAGQGRLSIVKNSVFSSAFAMTLIQAKLRGGLNWKAVQNEIKRILKSHDIEAEVRDEASKGTKNILQPVVMDNAINRARYGATDFFELSSGEHMFIAREKEGKKVFLLVNAVTGEERSIGLPPADILTLLKTKEGRLVIATNHEGLIRLIDAADMSVFDTFDLKALPGGITVPNLRGLPVPGEVNFFENEHGLGLMVGWQHFSHPQWLRIDLKTKEIRSITVGWGLQVHLTRDGRLLVTNDPKSEFESIVVSDFAAGEKPLLQLPRAKSSLMVGGLKLYERRLGNPWVEVASEGIVDFFNLDTAEHHRLQLPSMEFEVRTSWTHKNKKGEVLYFVQKKSQAQRPELWVFEIKKGTSRHYALPYFDMLILNVNEPELGDMTVLLSGAKATLGHNFDHFYSLNVDRGGLVRYETSFLDLSSRQHFFEAPDGRIIATMSDRNQYLTQMQIFGPVIGPGKDP
jgi:hypothetical protein